MGGPSSRRLVRLDGDPIRAFIESMTTGSNSNLDSANWPHLLGDWPTSALPREEEVGDHYGKFFILELGHLAVNYHCSRSVTVCCSLHSRRCPIACVCEARQDALPSYWSWHSFASFCPMMLIVASCSATVVDTILIRAPFQLRKWKGVRVRAHAGLRPIDPFSFL